MIDFTAQMSAKMNHRKIKCIIYSKLDWIETKKGPATNIAGLFHEFECIILYTLYLYEILIINELFRYFIGDLAVKELQNRQF